MGIRIAQIVLLIATVGMVTLFFYVAIEIYSSVRKLEEFQRSVLDKLDKLTAEVDQDNKYGD